VVPPVPEGLPGPLGVLVVFIGDPRPSQADLAPLLAVHLHFLTRVVHDLHLEAHGDNAYARLEIVQLLCRPVLHVALGDGRRGQRRGFGGSIGLLYGEPVLFIEIDEELSGDGRSAAGNGLERAEVVPPSLLEVVVQEKPDGGNPCRE